MNVFNLAILQIKREGKWQEDNKWEMLGLILDRAIKIRKYLDLQERSRKVWRRRCLKKK